MSETSIDPVVAEGDPTCESPPPTPRPAESPGDPRAELLRLADALTRDRSHRTLIAYLRARRALR